MFKLSVEQVLQAIDALDPGEQAKLRAELERRWGAGASDQGPRVTQSQSISGNTVGGSLIASNTGGDSSHRYQIGGASPEELAKLETAFAELREGLTRYSEENQLAMQGLQETLENLLKKPAPEQQPSKIKSVLKALTAGLKNAVALSSPLGTITKIVGSIFA